MPPRSRWGHRAPESGGGGCSEVHLAAGVRFRAGAAGRDRHLAARAANRARDAGLAPALDSGFAHGREIQVRARRPGARACDFQALVRIDTPQEVLYYKHGGILQYVLRQLLSQKN